MQRRTMLSGLAALVPMLGFRRLSAQESPAPSAPAKSCKLITQDVTGPYDIDARHIRADVREDEKGIPLTLDFQVISTITCQPLPDALVTIWHANREGYYSGVNNVVLNEDLTPADNMVDRRSASFLRGVQKSDAQGRVRFQTIVPGWYFPRATHVHVKVSPPDFGEVATTQLYFPNELCDQVYASEHYSHRGPNPVRMEPGQEDPLFASEAGDLWLDLQPAGDGFVASHELGVVFYGGMFGELTDAYRQS